MNRRAPVRRKDMVYGSAWTDTRADLPELIALRDKAEQQYRRIVSPWWRLLRLARRVGLFVLIPGVTTLAAAIAAHGMFGDTDNPIALGLSALGGSLAMTFGIGCAMHLANRLDR